MKNLVVLFLGILSVTNAFAIQKVTCMVEMNEPVKPPFTEVSDVATSMESPAKDGKWIVGVTSLRRSEADMRDLTTMTPNGVLLGCKVDEYK